MFLESPPWDQLSCRLPFCFGLTALSGENGVCKGNFEVFLKYA